MVGPAIRPAQTARHIVLATNAWPALKIGIAVMMSGVKTTVALDLKRSVSGIKIARGQRLCARRGAALSAVLIVIVLMDKPAATISAKEGSRMNAVTMRIVLSDSVVLIDAVLMTPAVALQIGIVLRTSGAKMGDV